MEAVRNKLDRERIELSKGRMPSIHTKHRRERILVGYLAHIDNCLVSIFRVDTFCGNGWIFLLYAPVIKDRKTYLYG